MIGPSFFYNIDSIQSNALQFDGTELHANEGSILEIINMSV